MRASFSNSPERRIDILQSRTERGGKIRRVEHIFFVFVGGETVVRIGLALGAGRARDLDRAVFVGRDRTSPEEAAREGFHHLLDGLLDGIGIARGEARRCRQALGARKRLLHHFLFQLELGNIVEPACASPRDRTRRGIRRAGPRRRRARGGCARSFRTSFGNCLMR